MRRNWIIVGLLTVGAVALAASVLAWRLTGREQTFLSDTATIHRPHAEAQTELREVLWQPPQRLIEPLNGSAEDYEPRLSWDGLTLFFVRGKAGSGADLFTATRTATGWSEPQPLIELNSEADDLGPAPTSDGQAIYFYSDRAGGTGGYDIWMARRGVDGWQPPTNLGPGVNSSFNDYGPTLAPDGRTLYFASNRPTPNDARQPNPSAWPATVREERFVRTYDLYRATLQEGNFSAAEPVADLNSPANEGAACVSPAGDFLYFSSDRSGGQGGFDLYRARLIGARVDSPQNVGRAINTLANELDPGLTYLGFVLYFSSDRARDLPPDAAPVAAAHETPRAAAVRPDYDLFFSASREVFREQVREPATDIDWAGLWGALWPWLLALLLALLLLVLLAKFFGADERRRLSLLARCLMASLMVHAVLLLLFSAWRVSAAVADALQSAGPTQVSLALGGSGNDLQNQIFAALSDAPEPPTANSTIERMPFTPDDHFESLRPVVPTTPADLPTQPLSAVVLVADSTDPSIRPDPVNVQPSEPPELAVRPPALEAPQAVTPEPTVAAPTVTATFEHLRVSAPVQSPEPSAAPRFDEMLLPAAHEKQTSAVDATTLPDAMPGLSRSTAALPEPEVPLAVAPTFAISVPAIESEERAAEEVPADRPRAALIETPTTRPVLASAEIGSAKTDAHMRPNVSIVAMPGGPNTSVAAAANNADSVPRLSPRSEPSIDSAPAALAGLRIPDAESPATQNRQASGQDGKAVASPPIVTGSVPRQKSSVAMTEPGQQIGDHLRSGPIVPLVATGMQSAVQSVAGLPTSEPKADSDPSLGAGRPTGADEAIRNSSAPSLRLGLPVEADPPPVYVQRAPEKRQSIVERMGGSDETEQAVDAALKWLAENQSPDGHWDGRAFDQRCQCGGTTDYEIDTALTGLSLLCFLGAGHTQAKEGPYRETVARSVRWLVDVQGDEGDLRRGLETMYSHGIATIALSEAYGMSGESTLRPPVQKAIDFILRARHSKTGGWRYEPGQPGDTSVFGWQMMALKSGALAGLELPGDALETGERWLREVGVRNAPGLYSYQPRQPASVAMTAEAMFVLQLVGTPREDVRFDRAARFISCDMPRWRGRANTYQWYYTTLALFQQQDETWERWNRALLAELLPNQRRDGRAAGSWDPVGEWASVGGRVYQTAMCTLMLEVYYRYLPLYTLGSGEAPNARGSTLDEAPPGTR